MTPEKRISKLERKVSDLDAMLTAILRETGKKKFPKTEKSFLKPNQIERFNKLFKQTP